MAKQDKFGRLRENRIALTRILRDDRLTPNRRILAFCLALWLDARDNSDRQFLQRLIEGVWISSSRTRWSDSEDPQEQPVQTNIEREAATQIKAVFDAMLKEKS